MNAQILSAFFSSKSLNLNITRARLIAGVFLHAGNAFSAAAIALKTVSLDAMHTCLETAPVEGLKIS
jgi:hypothetical protein